MKNFLSMMLALMLCLSLCACGNPKEHVHSYTEWTITKNATCTQDGSKERDCSCGDIQTEVIPAAGHICENWEILNDATCGENGSKEGICTTCSEKVSVTIDATGDHSFGEGTITKDATCTEAGNKTFTCSVCGTNKEEELTALGHSNDDNNTCTRCGLTTIVFTEAEITEAKKIAVYSYNTYESNDSIKINITFKDSNDYTVQCPAYVSVQIKDADGNVLYDKIIVKKSSQNSVTIDYSTISPCYTNKGTLYYKVYNDYASFDQVSQELVQLPWTVDISLPTLPMNVGLYYSHSGKQRECTVTEITYRISSEDLYLYFSGEKIYDVEGAGHSEACNIGWKLYDADGYVVADGNALTNALCNGERFRDVKAIARDCIKQGQTYRLEVLNIEY